MVSRAVEKETKERSRGRTGQGDGYGATSHQLLGKSSQSDSPCPSSQMEAGRQGLDGVRKKKIPRRGQTGEGRNPEFQGVREQTAYRPLSSFSLCLSEGEREGEGAWGGVGFLAFDMTTLLWRSDLSLDYPPYHIDHVHITRHHHLPSLFRSLSLLHRQCSLLGPSGGFPWIDQDE